MKTAIIAVSGKGGVGKTSVSAAIVKLLSEKYPDRKILAVDADPAVGLATSLGVDVAMTIDDIRKSIVQSVENGNTKAAVEMLGDARYGIYDAVCEKDGFAFIAVGRPEAAGCYCKINAYLKEVISMISGDFDFVVIDGEAGVEQINRRVMERVTHLLLVSDGSKKGLQVINTIKNVADSLVMYEKVGVIINRLPAGVTVTQENTGGIPVLACIGADDALVCSDIEGRSVMELPDDSPIVAGVAEALAEIGL